mmetsp:Transcript_16888/g.43210  ORF Transcript_16888/g.43210 Transcript_16888/m.43210 type:complete len:99 (-) Transcript_16888:510-806(-)
MIARARATRLRMPPLSSLGYRSSMPDRPTRRSDSVTRARTRSFDMCGWCSYNVNPTFCSTVRLSKSAADWKTMPTRKPSPPFSLSESLMRPWRCTPRR